MPRRRSSSRYRVRRRRRRSRGRPCGRGAAARRAGAGRRLCGPCGPRRSESGSGCVRRAGSRCAAPAGRRGPCRRTAGRRDRAAAPESGCCGWRWASVSPIPNRPGAIFTAVCRSEVVAPPMMTGRRSARRSSSSQTWAISSSDGVIRPLRQMQSAPHATASSTIRCDSTITPRSFISYPLQAITTATIFLPMSCTSPLTVAIRTLPALCGVWAPPCSMGGSGPPRRAFITRAVFTTCGRNILPSPKSVPTRSMAGISRVSITAIGVPRAS